MRFCVYGKSTGKWGLFYIRKTNGMVAITPLKNDSWIYKIKWVPWKAPKRSGAFTTFIWTAKRGFVQTFG